MGEVVGWQVAKSDAYGPLRASLEVLLQHGGMFGEVHYVIKSL